MAFVGLKQTAQGVRYQARCADLAHPHRQYFWYGPDRADLVAAHHDVLVHTDEVEGVTEGGEAAWNPYI